MLSVVFSNVTMPLHRKVRLQHEAAAKTMRTKADVACSHEARYYRAKKKNEHSDEVGYKQLSMSNPSSARMTAAVA